MKSAKEGPLAMRLFVGFFGFPRGWKFTRTSIGQNIYSPLERYGFSIFRAAHFNKPNFINAPRSGEVNIPFEIGDLTSLKLDALKVERQRDENIARYEEAALSVPFKLEDDIGGYTRRNSLHQLYSLKKLGEIFEANDPNSFSAVLLVRPDLRYLDPLPVKQLMAKINYQPNIREWPPIGALRRGFKPRAEIVTCSLNQNEGLNDRFALMTPAAAIAYMNRIDLVERFCKEFGYYHPESLLKFAMDSGKLRNAYTWVRAERVRSDGSVARLDMPGRKRRIYNKRVLWLRSILEI